MDVKLLYELKNEIDRIYALGLEATKRNSRIPKLIPHFEKFVDEDHACEELVYFLKEMSEPIADKLNTLSEIHTLLYYLLRLSEKDIPAEEERVEQVPFLDLNTLETNHSFLELNALIDVLSEYTFSPMALHSKPRPPRLEILQQAVCENKLFDDYRVYPYLNRALADNEPEIAEYAEVIIRNNVERDKILPFLLNSFECEDSDDNLRRFTLLYDFGYDGIAEILDEVLNGDALRLKAKAIEYLSKDVKYEDQLIELSDHPQRTLREMAYVALANLKTEKAERQLCKLYAKALKKRNKGEIELIARALLNTQLSYAFEDILAIVKEEFKNLIEAGKKADSEMFNHLKMGLLILKQKGRGAEICDFLLEIVLNKDYYDIIQKKESALIQSAKEISAVIIDIVQGLEAEKYMDFFDKVINEAPESKWKLPFYKRYMESYINNSSAEVVYDKFAPYYDKKNISITDLAELYRINDLYGAEKPSIDARWMDKLFEALERIDTEDNPETLLHTLDVLEPASSERYNKKLIEMGVKTQRNLLEITSMIIKRDLPDKYEIVYSSIKACHDRKDVTSSNALRQLSRATYWDDFPQEYIAKFRELKNAPKAILTKMENR